MYTTVNDIELKSIVLSFQKRIKPILSNYYGLRAGNNYCYIESEHTLLILKEEIDYRRVYIMTNLLSDATVLLKNLPSGSIVNIPSKKDIREWNDLLISCDFELLGVYKRYYNKKIKSRKSAIGEYATIHDIDQLQALITPNFNRITDYNPSNEELSHMINNNQVIVCKNEDKIVQGFLIYTIEGSKGYLNMWFDRSGNGLFLLHKVYSIFADRGIKFCYFWVNSQNRNVIRLHEIMGASFDGLKDYTYTKK